MPFTIFLIALIAYLPLTIHGAPLHHAIGNHTHGTYRAARHFCKENETTGMHIVSVRDGSSRDNVLKDVPSDSEIMQLDIINGFAGFFDTDTLDKIHSNPNVSIVSDDCVVNSHVAVTQENSPWGLARLSSRTHLAMTTPVERMAVSFTYDHSAGYCADIYIVDSGINTAHLDFGGRASLLATVGNWGQAQFVDDTGHGTHVAGAAGGTMYGVAKNARLLGVKVMGASGGGGTATAILGLQYVLNHASQAAHLQNRRHAVVNLSQGVPGGNILFDNAVNNVINAGITVVVSAGNENVDAGTVSPARVRAAITVGATTMLGGRWPHSNYGAAVDVFAPGENVMSAWIGNNTATARNSGSSIAAPYVAGLVAYLMCLEPNLVYSPAQMKAKVIHHSLRNTLSGIPNGTPNILAHLPLHP